LLLFESIKIWQSDDIRNYSVWYVIWLIFTWQRFRRASGSVCPDEQWSHINIWSITYSLIKCLQDRVTRYVFVIYWLLTIPHTSHGSDLHIWENLIRYMGCFWSKSDECQCVEYLPKSLPFYERFKFCFKFKFCLKFKFKFRGGNTMWGKGWRHKATVNLTHSVHSWSELLSFAFILSPKQTWLVSSTCDLHLVCETVPTIKPVHPLPPQTSWHVLIRPVMSFLKFPAPTDWYWIRFIKWLNDVELLSNHLFVLWTK